MSAVRQQIADARAISEVLRATGRAVRVEHGPLRLRLLRAAEALDQMVQLALSLIERIGRLEQEVTQLRPQGDSRPGGAQ